ncbi:hypothetical protein [Paenibacillus sp. RC67]|uniref:hypothetical protein n=1 Tax=Paenibacillus sp. RC67 TaxID=3039392 RepID=UPI0024AE6A27|nr:hypothetical protein [Paenibacillus sp. RC67]
MITLNDVENWMVEQRNSGSEVFFSLRDVKAILFENTKRWGTVFKDGEKIMETGEIITVNVYKISQEQKEMHERQAEERVDKARKEALTKICERYEQGIKKSKSQWAASDDGMKE